jgi:hypothetical protein
MDLLVVIFSIVFKQTIKNEKIDDLLEGIKKSNNNEIILPYLLNLNLFLLKNYIKILYKNGELIYKYHEENETKNIKSDMINYLKFIIQTVDYSTSFKNEIKKIENINVFFEIYFYEIKNYKEIYKVENDEIERKYEIFNLIIKLFTKLIINDLFNSKTFIKYLDDLEISFNSFIEKYYLINGIENEDMKEL